MKMIEFDLTKHHSEVSWPAGFDVKAQIRRNGRRRIVALNPRTRHTGDSSPISTREAISC